MTVQIVSRGRMLELGTVTTLPAVLANDLVSLRFVEHATYGVTLDTITNLDCSNAFPWVNAQQSDDGRVTGQLWRIGQDAGNEHNQEHNAEHGAGIEPLSPDDSVVCYSTTDPDGNPALVFRWDGLALAHGGTIDVTALVSLAADAAHAEWNIYVDRHGTGADALDHIAFPILALVGPVPARDGSTHAEGQVRARALLPAHETPEVGDENVPLTFWDGEEVQTQHPRGYSANGVTVATQPYQFEALAAVDPQDLDSVRQVMILGSADTRGQRKQYVRAGLRDGDSLIYYWEHRFIPPWATWPILGPDSTTRLGNVFFSRYPAITAVFRAPTAAWDFSACIWYRDHVAERMAAPPRAASSEDPGVPLIVSTEATSPMDGATLGGILSTWDGELREMTGAAAAFAEWHNLAPSPALPEPTTDFTALRGTNYLPITATSHCLHLGLVPMVADGSGLPTTAGGFFNEAHFTAEMEVLQGVGFNNVRLWGSLLGYMIDPAGYMASLKTACRVCHERGIGVTYVMFNQIPAGIAATGGSAYSIATALDSLGDVIRAALWTTCNAWQNNTLAPDNMPVDELDLTHFPEPMTGAEWISQGRYGEWSNTTFQAAVGEYVRAIANFFGTDEDGNAAFHSVDLYNECNLVFESAARANVIDFVCKVEQAMRRVFPGVNCTVGWAGSPVGLTTELVRAGCRLSYGSMHCYAYTATTEEFAAIEAVLQAAKAETDLLGIPLVLSEFYVRPENAGQMQLYLDMLERNAPVGGQAWSYLQNNAYRDSVQSGTWDYHGFSYPFDGLVTCAIPALQVKDTDTLTFNPTGGEHNEEHNAEHNIGAGLEQADRAAIAAWVTWSPT